MASIQSSKLHLPEGAELGMSVEEVCRKLDIGDTIFYNWKKKYDLDSSEQVNSLCN